MAQYREILKAITDLDKKVDNIREEMLLNREDINFVKEMKKVTTVSQYKESFLKVDSIIAMKNKALGVLVASQFFIAALTWYLNKL
jgi:hypothetical protein